MSIRAIKRHTAPTALTFPIAPSEDHAVLDVGA